MMTADMDTLTTIRAIACLAGIAAFLALGVLAVVSYLRDQRNRKRWLARIEDELEDN